MSDSPQTHQASQEEPHQQSKEELKSQVQTLETENKVLGTWTKSSNDLIEQYKNKFDAFRALADETGYIEQKNFNLGGEVKAEIFKKIDEDGDGKISKEEWNKGWNQLDTKYQENQHRLNMVQQKMEILDALDSKQEPGKRLDESTGSTNYTNFLDKFKGTRNLEDLTNLFSQGSFQKSPFKPQKQSYQQVQEPEVLSQINFDLKRPTSKKVESILTQYKTPNKQIDLIENTNSGRGSYITSQLGTQYAKPIQQTRSNKQSSGKSPQTRFGSQQFGSPSVGFIQTSSFNKVESVSSKVQQQMNLQLETKEYNKTNKRKEELQNFMGKLGLGKYDTPKVTVTLEQSNPALERLKNYVNGTGITSQRKTSGFQDQQQYGDQSNRQNYQSSQGLAAFKPQNRAQQQRKPDRQGSRSKSNGRDAVHLADQSLKSFTLKMLHQQRNSNGSNSGNNNTLKYTRN